MALGDYQKTTYINGSAPSISAERLNKNEDKTLELDTAVNAHLSDNLYQTAGGTATAIALTIGETLINGLPITFIALANNNASATTINSIPLYKPNTTTTPTLIAGKAYTVWYNSTGNCFFIKASATGTVTSNKVLANETYSTEENTDLIGTMPNNTAANTPCSDISAISGRLHMKPKTGYFDQNGANSWIYRDDANFIATNILEGVSIFNLAGSARKPTFSSGIAYKFDGNIAVTSVTNVYAPTKVREMRINYSGVYKVTFWLAFSGGDGAWGYVYKNGVQIGTSRYVYTYVMTYSSFTEEFTFEKDDLIQIYTRPQVSTGTAYIQGFSVATEISNPPLGTNIL